MTGGFSPALAHSALKLGWSKAEILDAHRASHDLSVTRIQSFAAVLEERWLLYRGLWCLPDLELALSPLLPAEASLELTVAYADGSSSAPGRGRRIGSGVALYEPGRPPRYLAEHEGDGTNNVAELLALWRALKAVPDARRRLLVRTDSQYAIGCVEERGWHLKSNVDLIRAIRRDVDLRRALGQEVSFEHVRGHAGEEGNEAADRMAYVGKAIATGKEPLVL